MMIGRAVIATARPLFFFAIELKKSVETRSARAAYRGAGAMRYNRFDEDD
jgi:hypothetical protein